MSDYNTLAARADELNDPLLAEMLRTEQHANHIRIVSSLVTPLILLPPFAPGRLTPAEMQLEEDYRELQTARLQDGDLSMQVFLGERAIGLALAADPSPVPRIRKVAHDRLVEVRMVKRYMEDTSLMRDDAVAIEYRDEAGPIRGVTAYPRDGHVIWLDEADPRKFNSFNDLSRQVDKFAQNSYTPAETLAMLGT